MTLSTILFADICASTSLYEQIGDTQAESVISSCLGALSQQVIDHNGTVLDTIGDEIMCRFDAVDDAIIAAGDMQQCTRSNRFGNDQRSVAIRIGAHTGSVIQVASGIQGDTVNVSARITALARAGKIMISEPCYQALPSTLKTSCRHMLETQLKGKQQLMNVYEFVWESNDQLTRVANIQRSIQKEYRLVLEYQGQSVYLKKGSLTVGRGDDCDLTVHSAQASRKHCEIRMNGNKFVLFDNSTNGTFIVQNHVEMFFHQESAPMHQNGIISLGISAKNSDDSENILFRIEPVDA